MTSSSTFALPREVAALDTDRVLADLVGRRAPAVGTGHDRTRSLVDRLGLDPTSVPTVHVTGTNGKTSTVRMVDAILRAAGLSTVRFTSPHLHRVGQRVAVDGVSLDDTEVARRVVALAPSVAALEVDGVTPSFFDVVTTLFWQLAAEVAPDVAVVEVGRGGRDDATNVGAADVAVFTPIGGDHSDLGATRTALAHTKLGIVTHGGRSDRGPRLVSARQSPDVAGLVARTACARGLSLTTVGSHAGVVGVETTRHGQRVEAAVRSGGSTGRDVCFDLPAHGRHQADNAVLALLAAEAFLRRPLATSTLRSGFAATSTPGRLDVRRVGDVTVRLDGAHNAPAAAALVGALPSRDGRAGSPGGRVLVLGAAGAKDLDGMLAWLGPVVDEVVATTVPTPGAVSAVEVAAAAVRAGLSCRVVADPDAAMATALQCAGPGDEVLVTGSLHLVGALRDGPALTARNRVDAPTSSSRAGGHRRVGVPA